MYHILTVGSGYLGLEIASYFAGKNQKVFSITRNPEKKQIIEERGITPVICDINRPGTLNDIPPAHFIVICVSAADRSPEAYSETYLTGVKNFLESRKSKPAPFMILYISSTGVWGRHIHGKVDERVRPDPKTERERILVEAEEQVLCSGYPAAVFRLAGIYGPGRNRIAAVKRGEWPERESNSYINLIHRDDVVHAIPVLFNSAQPGEVYVGVDDEPVSKFEYFSWIAGKLGVETPAWLLDSQTKTGKQCLNRKLKELDFIFKYPNFREGYKSLLEV